MEKYQFIITKSEETRDFLKKNGFIQVGSPIGTYMFLFDKSIFTFTDRKLNFSLTNKLTF